MKTPKQIAQHIVDNNWTYPKDLKMTDAIEMHLDDLWKKRVNRLHVRLQDWIDNSNTHLRIEK